MRSTKPDGRAKLLILLLVGAIGAAATAVLRSRKAGSDPDNAKRLTISERSVESLSEASAATSWSAEAGRNGIEASAATQAAPVLEVPPVHIEHAVLVDGPGVDLAPQSAEPPTLPATQLLSRERESASADSDTAHPETAVPDPAKLDPTQTGPFYGWILVAAVFVILTISSGVGFYNASVILSAATRELGASVGAVSGATGMFFAIGGLTGFVFSKRMESVDLRLFYVAGGIVGACALIGLRWVTSVAGLYVFFAFFGMAFGLAGLVPSTTLVTRWFDRRRAVALSIASTGLSVGGIVITPISGWIIEQQTLAGAGPYLAAIWIVGIIPIALLFVRSYPADKGLQPDGDPPKEPAATNQPTTKSATDQPTAIEAATEQPTSTSQPTTGQVLATQPTPDTTPQVRGLSFTIARRTRFFIALCVAYAVIFFGQVGAIAQLYNMVLERTDASTAKTSLSVLAFSSVVARLIGGAAVLHLPTKSFSAVLTVLQAGALVLLAVTNSSIGLILSAAFFGVSIGNLLMLQPLLLAETFGVANYGRIYSFNQLFGTIGVAGGPLILGVLRDQFDYRIAFFAAASASITGCIAIIAAGSPTRIQALWE